MGAGWIAKGADTPAPASDVDPWKPVGPDTSSVPALVRPHQDPNAHPIDNTRGLFTRGKDLLFGHEPDNAQDPDQAHQAGILPAVGVAAKNLWDQGSVENLSKGPALSTLATAYPHLVGAQFGKVKAGYQEQYGAAQVQDAERTLAALNVLPQVAARTKPGDLDPVIAMSKDPLVDKTARKLGISPQEFAGDWNRYQGFSPEEQADMAARAHQTLQKGQASLTAGRDTRLKSWAEERAWQPADLANGKLDPMTLKGAAFNVMLMAPQLAAVTGAAAVGGAVAGPGGAALAGGGTAAALFAPEQRTDAKNKIDDQVSRLMEKAHEISERSEPGNQRALNPIVQEIRQQAADLEANSDRIANTAGFLYAVGDAAGALPVSAVLSRTPAGKAVMDRIVGATLGKTVLGRMAGTMVANGAGGAVQGALQKAVDVGIVHEQTSLADALKDIAYTGLMGALTAAPISAVHELAGAPGRAREAAAAAEAKRNMDADEILARVRESAAAQPGGPRASADTYPGYKWNEGTNRYEPTGAGADRGASSAARLTGPASGAGGAESEAAGAGSTPPSGNRGPRGPGSAGGGAAGAAAGEAGGAEGPAGAQAKREAFQSKIDALNTAAASAEKRSDVTLEPEEDGWSVHVKGEPVARFETAEAARQAMAQARKVVGTKPAEAGTETPSGATKGPSGATEGPKGETALERTQPIQTERRVRGDIRQRVDQMNPEQLKAALLTHELTGIPNRRAYEESDKKPSQVSIDVDSLKWINDHASHDGGDQLLKSVAQALHESTGGNAYHISGDEFVVQGDNHDHAEQLMQAAKARLNKATLTFQHPDGRTITLSGIGLSHGTGTTLEQAETELHRAKEGREAAGLRSARGEQPPNARVEAGAAGVPAGGGEAAAPVETRAKPGPTRGAEIAKEIAKGIGGGTEAKPAVNPFGHRKPVTVMGQEVQRPAIPTAAQAKSGNYFKPRVHWRGLPINVENVPGQIRRGIGSNGKPFERRMKAAYGEFHGHEGADGDHVDVMMGAHPEAEKAYVIDQLDHTGTKFDEHKVQIGVRSAEEAREQYLSHYPKGWKGLGAITELSAGQLKRWLHEGDLRAPLSADAVPKAAVKRGPAPDARHDSVLEYLARHPRGLDIEEAGAQGIDPADMRLSAAHVGIKRAFRRNGMSFDHAAETLAQDGYPVLDEDGRYSPNVLLDRIDDELRGKKHYSHANVSHTPESKYARDWREPVTDEELEHMSAGETQARLDALEAEAERLSREAMDEAPESDEDLERIPFARQEDFSLTAPGGKAGAQEKKPVKGGEQQDLFGDKVAVKNEIARMRTALEEKQKKAAPVETGKSDDLFSQARGQAEIPGMDTRDPKVLARRKEIASHLVRFASGMSRPGDIVAGSHGTRGTGKLGIGVDVGELSAAGIKHLAAEVAKGADVFVDSGAFSLFRRQLKAEGDVKPLDFDAILGKYDALLEELHDADEAEEGNGQLLLVMPDVVGDQAASLDLIAKHAAWIKPLTYGDRVRPIIPIQKGTLSLGDAYKRIAGILNTRRFIVGVPSSEEAVSTPELEAFLKHVHPQNLHFLGAISDKNLGPKLDAIAAAGMDPLHLSADGNLLRSTLYGKQAPGVPRREAVARTLETQAGKMGSEAAVSTAADRAHLAKRSAARERNRALTGTTAEKLQKLQDELTEVDAERQRQYHLFTRTARGKPVAPAIMLRLHHLEDQIAALKHDTVEPVQADLATEADQAWSPLEPIEIWQRTPEEIREYIAQAKAANKPEDVKIAEKILADHETRARELREQRGPEPPAPKDHPYAAWEQRKLREADERNAAMTGTSEQKLKALDHEQTRLNAEITKAAQAGRAHGAQSKRGEEIGWQRKALKAEPPTGETQSVPLPKVEEGGTTYEVNERAKQPRIKRTDPNAPQQLDILANASAPAAAGNAARLATSARLNPIGEFRTGIKQVKTYQDAAHIFAPWRKMPQEHMGALVLDKRGTPLAVIRHTIGVSDGASVEPWSLAGAIMQVPGAAKVYFGHNHPSGKVDQSQADHFITDKLHKLLEGTGIKSMGMIVVAPGSKSASHYVSKLGGFDEGQEQQGRMTIAARTGRAIPIYDRRFAVIKRKLPPYEFARTAGSPNVAKQVVEESGEKSGALLLDKRHQVVGIVPMSTEEMGKLRTGDPAHGAGRLLKAMAESNAGALIAFGDLEAARNVALFANAAGGRALDVMHWGPAGDIISEADRGGMQVGDAFLKRGTPGEGGGMQVGDVRSVVHKILQGFKVRPQVTVVDTLHDLDDHPEVGHIVRDEANSEAVAFVHPRTNKIYLIADQLHSPEHVASAFAHEYITHFGLRAALGDRRNAQYQAILDGVAKAMPAELRARGEQEFPGTFNPLKTHHRNIAAEEVLAYYGQEYARGQSVPQRIRRWLDKLAAMIRDWVRQVLGLPQKFDELFVKRTLADLESFLRRSREPRSGTTSDTEPAFASPQDTFFSGLAKAVDAAKREKGTGAEWEATLKNMPGVKADELKWTGLKEWLEGRGRVSKAEVAHFVHLHRVQVGEVERGGTDYEKLNRALEPHGYAMEPTMDDEATFVNLRDPEDTPQYDDLPDEVRTILNDRQFSRQPTKYAQYSTPGGSNYRELLLTLPGRGEKPEVRAKRAELSQNRLRAEVEERAAQKAAWEIADPNLHKMTPRDFFRMLSDASTEQGYSPRINAILALEKMVDSHDPNRQIEVQQAANAAVEAGAKLHAAQKAEEDHRNSTIDHGDLPMLEERLARYRKIAEAAGQDMNAAAEKFYETMPNLSALDRANAGLWLNGLFLRDPAGAADDMAKLERLLQWHNVERGPELAAAVAASRLMANAITSKNAVEDRVRSLRSNLPVQTHWDEPNVVAHTRFDDRTGPNGEKILHINEVQSDWHQKGRLHGYLSTDVPDREALGAARTAAHLLAREAMERNDNLGFDTATLALNGIYTEGANWPNAWPDHTPEDREIIERWRLAAQAEVNADQRRTKAVPDAPFKTTWPELVMKRMLRYAAEQGYDALSWDTGRTNAERYNMSNHVDAITVWQSTTEHGPNGEPIYHYEAKKNGRQVARDPNPGVTAEVLGDHIGTELSKDAIAKLGRHEDARYEGLNLDMGGEGMKAFYDKMLPAAVGKLVKKFGAKVESSEIAGDYGPSQYFGPSFDAEEIFDKLKNGPELPITVREQLRQIAIQRTTGVSMQGAMATFGSPAAAEALGGELLEPQKAVPQLRHWLEHYASEHGMSVHDLGDATKGQIEIREGAGKIPDALEAEYQSLTGRHMGGAHQTPLSTEEHARMNQLGEMRYKARRYGVLPAEVFDKVAQHNSLMHGMREAVPTHKIQITPALRDSVLGGQPMFLKRRKGSSGEEPTKPRRGPMKFARDVVAAIPHTELNLSFRRIVDPANVSEPAKATAVVTREALGELAQSSEQALQTLEQFSKQFDLLNTEDRYSFIDAMEGGQPTRPDLQPAADTIRKLLDEWRENIRGLGVGALDNFIENYFPHIWKRDDRAKRVFGQIFGRRPLKGPASFLKERTIPTTREGLDAGLTPISTNPLVLAFAKLREMMRFHTGVRLMQRFKDEGLAKFLPSGKLMPDGWGEINDAVGRVRQWSEVEQGFIERGRYIMPVDAARVINNHLSGSALRNFLPALLFRSMSNAANALQLGFSAFHLGFTTLDAIVSKNALAVERLLNGEPLKAAGALLEASLAGAPMNLVRGHRLLKAYVDPKTASPEMRRIVEGLAAAGGRVKMDNYFQAAQGLSPFKGVGVATLAHDVRMALSQPHGKVLEATKILTSFPQQYATRLWRDLVDMTHTLSWPWLSVPLEVAGRVTRASTSIIMEHIVPLQKLGVFADLASDHIRRNPHEDSVAFAAAMQSIWNSVDNRLGEMVYDNVFWNRTFKDVNHMMVRAVGWNLGTIRELGGAPIDAVKLLDYLARGAPAEGGQSPLGKGIQARQGYEEAKSKIQRIAEKTGHKIPYTLALIGTTMLLGAILTRLMTGEGPKEIKDYFFPPTGRKTKYGTPERMSMPSYTKDLYEYGTQPVNTLINKANPIFGIIHSIYANEDFYGNPVRDPDAGPWTQMWEGAKYAGVEVAPFSLQGARQYAASGESAAMQTAPYVGFGPAPARVTSPEQMDRYQLRETEKGYIRGLQRRLRQATEKGDQAKVDELRQEIREHKLKERGTEHEIREDKAKGREAQAEAAAKISQLLEGKSRKDAAAAAHSAGYPALAALLRSLPDRPRARVATSLEAFA